MGSKSKISFSHLRECTQVPLVLTFTARFAANNNIDIGFDYQGGRIFYRLLSQLLELKN